MPRAAQKTASGGLGHRGGHALPAGAPPRGQGLLHSKWREGEGREHRYYKISAFGEAVFQALIGEWQTINQSLKLPLKETPLT